MERHKGQAGGEIEANGKEMAQTCQKVVDDRYSAGRS